jgi:predicted dehydrogenase
MGSTPKDGFAIVAFSDLHDSFMKRAKAKFNKDGATYKDYREMVVSDDVDAVVVATPDHWHALPSIDACKAGKDVYVEKPLTLTIAEGRAMVKAARENGCIVQVGSQQRNGHACMQGCQAVLDGAIGKVTRVHAANYPSPWDCDITEEQEVPEGLDWDTWMGQSKPHPFHNDIFTPRGYEGNAYPDGRPYGWISYTPWSGGEMTGWGAHGLDIIQWGLGTEQSCPVEVWPELEGESGPIVFQGQPLKDDSWEEGRSLTCPVHFKYADGTTVHLDGQGPAGGGLFVGEEGTILVSRGRFQTKMNGEDMKNVGDPKGSNDTTAHMNHWLDCIKSRELSRADVEVAHRSCTMCHLGNIARWVGRKLTWDPETETFGDDAEANSYISREAREPWVVA